jgi:hypothetical protein
MFETRKANARSRSRNAVAAVPARIVAPGGARNEFLQAVGRQLSRAIRRPVLTCLLWRVTAYRVRQRTARADAAIQSRRGTFERSGRNA